MPRGAAQSALEPIMTATYNALVGSAVVTALAPVLNHVPQGTPRPYLVVETPTEVPWNTMGEFGKDVTLQLHAVSEAMGDQEALRILNAAIGALDYSKPSISSHQCVSFKYEHGSSYKEELVGGVIVRHHIALMRVFVAQST